jgi:hypothetical protein
MSGAFEDNGLKPLTESEQVRGYAWELLRKASTFRSEVCECAPGVSSI